MAKSYWNKIKEDWKNGQDKQKREKERLEKIHKGFVWYGTRTLFWMIIVLNIYNNWLVNNQTIGMYLGIFVIILSIPLIILSIIHFNIYKKDGRGYAILGLIISGLNLGIFLLGLASVTATISPTQTTAQTSLSNQVTTPDYAGNCPVGYILGQDNKCHQECIDNSHYCQNGGVCFNNQCVTCPSGLIPGQDGLCHETCGSPNTYCQNPDVQYCLNNQCVTCPSGYVLRTDGKCYLS